MDKKRKELLLNIIGAFFVLVVINQLLVMFIFSKNFRYAFWFSDHVPTILALGILFRKKIIVAGEMVIALIPETIWTIDFISKVFFDRYVFNVVGVSQYLFTEGVLVKSWQNLSTIQHVFIVPLGLTALFLMGWNKNAWKFSLGHMVVLLFASLAIGPEYNINCIYHPCSYILNIPQQYYMILWPIAALLLIPLTTIILKGLLRLGKKNI